MCEAGIAQAKIVQTDFKTRAFKFFKVLNGQLFAIQDGGFCNFQFNQRRCNVMFCQHVQHGIAEVVLAQLQRRDIDAERSVNVHCLPFAQLLAGQSQHFHAQVDDKTAAFGHTDEAVGVDQAKFRVSPAHQGFKARYSQVIQVDLGLVVQNELTLLQCVTHGLLDMEFFNAGGVKRWVKEAELPATGTFCRIHGRIGAADQRVNVLGVTWTNGDTHAWAGDQLGTLQRIGG